MEYINHWKHEKAKAYAKRLLNSFGKPDCVLRDKLLWVEPYVNVSELSIKDEELFSDFPTKHYNFVYSTSSIRLSPQQTAQLAFICNNIMVDQLGGKTTAICGTLLSNQVTLGFAYDISIGRLFGTWQQLREEYKYRLQHKVASQTGEYPLPQLEN